MMFFKILNKLHKWFPHHIPGMTEWVYETMIKGNQELLEQSMAAKYIALALEVIEMED